MKFGSNLQAHLTPEWRSQYIDYEVLKAMLYECKDEIPNGDVRPDEITERNVARFEEQFFAECDVQLQKVNTFFAEKLAESTRRFAMLQSELQAHKESIQASGSSTLTLRRKVSRPQLLLKNEHKVHIRTTKDLKLAFSEFYLNLVLLQNYQELNFTGFRKILKKHDKMLCTDKGASWRMRYVETSPFHKDSLISEYILKTENLYINDLENGDRSKAMKRLRVPPLSDHTTYPKGTVFRVGLFLGMFITIMVVVVFAAIFIKVDIDVWLVVDLYKAAFILFLFIMCLGFNIWGWRAAGVNHVLIFEIDPRMHLSHQHFFEISSIFSIIWGISLCAFLFGLLPQLSSYFPPYLNPGLVYATYLAFLFNPLPIFFHRARFWLLKRFWRLFACGFYRVEFADFWIADQLNSLAVLLLDAEFIICYYAFEGNIWLGTKDIIDDPSSVDMLASARDHRYSAFAAGIEPVCDSYSYGVRAVVACYPAYIRFVQCIRRFYDSKKWFPHLVNAGKYSTTFFRETFHALYVLHNEQTQEVRSVYFYLWLASLFINSCYTLAWDLKMDWGFFDRQAGENKFLREEIVYPYKTIYYLAMIEDSIIRFSWIIKVSVQQAYPGSIVSQVVSTLTSILEVLRRFIWNFFRLENEHLNNCGEFRAVRDISIAPLRTDDLAKLERMMDDVCGADSLLLKTRMRRPLSMASSSTSPRSDSLTGRRNSTSVLIFAPQTDRATGEGTSTSAV